MVTRTLQTATALAVVICLTLCLTGCPQSSRDRDAAYARDVAGAFRAAAPLVAPLNAGLAAQMTKAADNADLLAQAFASSNKDQVVALIAEVLPVFTQVAETYSQNQTILTALALGQIALNFIVDHYLSHVSLALKARTRAGGAEQDVIDRFRALPQFGCQMRPEKCH